MKKIKVEFLGPIGIEAQYFELSNLIDLKQQLQKIEVLKEWLPLSAIAINDQIIEDLNYSFKDGDKVALLPPVCGG